MPAYSNKQFVEIAALPDDAFAAIPEVKWFGGVMARQQEIYEVGLDTPAKCRRVAALCRHLLRDCVDPRMRFCHRLGAVKVRTAPSRARARKGRG